MRQTLPAAADLQQVLCGATGVAQPLGWLTPVLELICNVFKAAVARKPHRTLMAGICFRATQSASPVFPCCRQGSFWRFSLLQRARVMHGEPASSAPAACAAATEPATNPSACGFFREGDCVCVFVAACALMLPVCFCKS